MWLYKYDEDENEDEDEDAEDDEDDDDEDDDDDDDDGADGADDMQCYNSQIWLNASPGRLPLKNHREYIIYCSSLEDACRTINMHQVPCQRALPRTPRTIQKALRKIHTALKDAVFLRENFQKTSIYVLDSFKKGAVNAKALVCRYL